MLRIIDRTSWNVSPLFGKLSLIAEHTKKNRPVSNTFRSLPLTICYCGADSSSRQQWDVTQIVLSSGSLSDDDNREPAAIDVCNVGSNEALPQISAGRLTTFSSSFQRLTTLTTYTSDQIGSSSLHFVYENDTETKWKLEQYANL